MYKQFGTNTNLITLLRRTTMKNQIINQCRQYQCGEKGVYGYRNKSAVKYSLDAATIKRRQEQSNFVRWVEAYRVHAHRLAQTNPIEWRQIELTLAEVQIDRYGLNERDVQNFAGILNAPEQSGSIETAKRFLERVYCGETSVEFAYIESEFEREWLAEHYEKTISSFTIDGEAKKEIAELLLKSQLWDNFLATKFPSVKRYGGEGAESMMAFFWQILRSAASDDLSDLVIGMPHRGRLNVLTTVMKTRPAKVFRKLKGLPEFPGDAKFMGDVVSHFNVSEDFDVDGKIVHISMLHNPSHLEAVNPVSMGKTRSKQQMSRDGVFSSDPAQQLSSNILNVQLHGDAAFSGQGINQEMLMMSGTPHFDVGGTVHLIVNNQIGYTTPGDRGRSTRYCSDLAKSINAPVFHVNGDNPEALIAVTKLAVDYQRTFRKDVFIDFMCFRRWGHNELDDPMFTNPAVYKVINNRQSVPDMYAKRLINHGVLTEEQVNRMAESYTRYLNEELANLNSYQPDASYFKKQWKDIEQAPASITTWDTGMDYNILHHVGKQSVHIPENFSIHPHLLKTHVKNRLTKIDSGEKIDWATAEALAIGSLMYQGHNVRFSGEDVGRGTFSQRHAMIVDQNTNEMYIPLNDLKFGDGGKLEIANSILSEEAVLAFEYGMAIDNPNNLIIWEAQFGDFYNGAQIIVDTFIVSGESKWMQSNALVMLLPHGFDGTASEHSSSRMERFLQLSDSKETSPDGDDVNVQIIYPTTPAQYFHALRRQIIRNFRKPLIVVGPKTLLRLSGATSSYTEFLHGTTFKNVIGDSTVSDASKVKKVVLCTGKHFYNLSSYQKENSVSDVAIVRIESLSPFPVHDINEELKKYGNAKTIVWSQEEHRNMGAWTFVKPRFENMCGKKIAYCGRNEAPTVAVGVSSWHKIEADEVIANPFKI